MAGHYHAVQAVQCPKPYKWRPDKDAACHQRKQYLKLVAPNTELPFTLNSNTVDGGEMVMGRLETDIWPTWEHVVDQSATVRGLWSQ